MRFTQKVVGCVCARVCVCECVCLGGLGIGLTGFHFTGMSSAPDNPVYIAIKTPSLTGALSVSLAAWLASP